MISICMPFYNRRAQLLNSIWAIERSSYKDFEMIIVDDASREEERIDDLPSIFPFIKVLRIDDAEKVAGSSPVIPFNRAIKEASGDKLIITNPECTFIGDVMQYTADHCNDLYCISFACLSLTEEISKELFTNPESSVTNHQKIVDLAANTTNPPSNVGQLAWYNHSRIRPVAYHFCNAISRNVMMSINGFDERYVQGICFDDDDLLHRIRCAGTTVKIIDEPFVVHQWHCSAHVTGPSSHADFARNQKLFQSIVKGETPMWGKNMKGILNAE